MICFLDHTTRFRQTMAAGGLFRRIKPAGANSLTEDIDDDRPAFLRQFPNSPNVLKDINLGVLLGRQERP
jgi:hypothetical protein